MNRLGRLHRSLLYAVTAVLLASGGAWLASWHKAAAMAVHGAAAMAALVLIGALLPRHLPCGWTQGRNRTTGSLLLGAAALLSLSGYILYYAGDEALRALTSDVHIVVGLALPALLALHVRRRVTLKGEEESR